MSRLNQLERSTADEQLLERGPVVVTLFAENPELTGAQARQVAAALLNAADACDEVRP